LTKDTYYLDFNRKDYAPFRTHTEYFPYALNPTRVAGRPFARKNQIVKERKRARASRFFSRSRRQIYFATWQRFLRAAERSKYYHMIARVSTTFSKIFFFETARGAISRRRIGKSAAKRL
jgi:hypothetical protein